MSPSELLIDGTWSAAEDGGRRDIVNPSDASVIASVAEATASDADRAVRAARSAFDEGSWSRAPATRRADVLTSLADALQERREEFAHLETLDTGKTVAESRFDVDDTTAVLRYYAALSTADAGRTVETGRPGALSRVVHEPVEDGLPGCGVQRGEAAPGAGVQEVEDSGHPARPLRTLGSGDTGPEPHTARLGCGREVVRWNHGVDGDRQPVHVDVRRTHLPDVPPGGACVAWTLRPRAPCGAC